MTSNEQPLPELLLQVFDMPTYRRMSNMQLIAGHEYAPMPGHGLEGRKRTETL
jgi:hypothetical protein